MNTDDETSIGPHHVIRVAIKGDPRPVSSSPQIELDLSKFKSARWALQLDEVFARRREPAVILAQGVACLAVAWWAQLSPRGYVRSVKGAVFMSPLTIGFRQEGIAAAARLAPTLRLPFPSVIIGIADPFVDALLTLADDWGSLIVEAGTSPPSTNTGAVCSNAEAQLIDLLPLLTSPASTGLFAFSPEVARNVAVP